MILGDGESHQDIEIHGLVPIGLDKLRRRLAELEALPHVLLRHTEALRDALHLGTPVDQFGKGGKLVRRVHTGAVQVLGEGILFVRGRTNHAGRHVGLSQPVLLLQGFQRVEAAAAGDDFEVSLA